MDEVEFERPSDSPPHADAIVARRLAREEADRVKRHRANLDFEIEWLRLDNAHSRAIAFGQPLRANRVALLLNKLEIDHICTLSKTEVRRKEIVRLRSQRAALKRERKRLLEKGKKQ